MTTDARQRVSQTVGSIWILQALYAGIELGVFDALSPGPRDPAALAVELGVHEGALVRLVRGLELLGLLQTTPDAGVALTEAGRVLTRDAPGSLAPWAKFRLGPGLWRAWGCLVDVVRTGRCVGELDGHADWMAAFEDDGEQARLMDESMTVLTRRSAELVVSACDLADAGHVVDLGGGTGELMAAVLRIHPHLTGVVFDRERLRARAEALFARRGLADRGAFVVGSFFDAVPAGAGAYLLKSCLCDWDDARTVAILRTCRAAMAERSRLLVIEPMIPDRLIPSSQTQTIIGSDLNMLVVTGGRERTESELRGLLSSAGLRVSDVRETGLLFKVIEARI